MFTVPGSPVVLKMYSTGTRADNTPGHESPKLDILGSATDDMIRNFSDVLEAYQDISG